MQPYVCPVCNGRGTVPASFYGDYTHIYAVKCRSCDGIGIVWEPSSSWQPIFSPNYVYDITVS